MKRALRRHHSARMKAKAREFFWIRESGWEWGEEKWKEFEDAAAKRADYLKTCSCSMCGNSRHYLKGDDKLTVQEIKAKIKDREEGI